MSGHDASETLAGLLSDRHSCRAFLPEQVEPAKIEQMLEMAQRAPSWCNSQPWQTIVTHGEGTERFRAALHDAALVTEPRSDVPGPAEYRGVYLERRRETGFAMYERLGIERSDREGRRRQELENFRLFGAPHVAIVTTDAALGPYGYVDSGAYLSVLLLAAQSLGIAAVPQAAIAMYSDVVRKHFELPEDRLVLLGVSFGHADVDHPVNQFRTTRAAVGDAVRWIGS